MKKISLLTVMIACMLLCSLALYAAGKPEKAVKRHTTVSIKGEQFLINGKPTYKGRNWEGHSIEGLLMNSRMVQGIFDDSNPATAGQWTYPDTKKWDADRNTNEFIRAMDEWYAKGLLAFTINLQGGSPVGYGNSGWINSAIDSKGGLKADYMARLEKILNRADEKGMVVILGIFYFGQDQVLENEAAIINGVDQTIDWLFTRNYRNILIEVNNECNVKAYDHEILKPQRVHELIGRIKSKEKNGFRFLTGTSYGGGAVPKENVVKSSDFILIHGNGVKDPVRISEMVRQTREVTGYKPMPILFNEDDHFDFDKPVNNFTEAVRAYASWGYFDYRMKDEGFDDGYQSVPVNWGISSPRKKAFFDKLEEITCGLKYIGHRGASYYAPENTLAAIRLAFELGADGAECDIRLTRDNQVVLWHDDNTLRLTGQNLDIAKTDYAELKQLKIKLSPTNSSYFGEERMPLLKDVLKSLPKDQLLVIEIKCGTEIFPHLQKVMKDSWKSGAVAFISFGYETIAMAKSLYPEVPCYYLTSKKEELYRRIPEIQKDKLDGVDLQSKIVDKESVEMLEKAKIGIWCWTVDDVDEALRMKNLGVRMITTNRPTWLKEQIAVRDKAGNL